MAQYLIALLTFFMTTYQKPSDTFHMEDGSKLYRSANHEQPGLAKSKQTLEPPKLNLKLQSQSIELLERNAEVQRNAVFGGARPRELVLKDRGIGDVAASNHGSQLSSRVKQNSPKAEKVTVHTACHNGKAESIHGDKIVKQSDRRDHRADVERNDTQRQNRQNEKWKNRGNEKHSNQQQGRPPSSEIWHKAVEHQHPASFRTTVQRYCKAASAVELAQASSKSVSDPTVANHLSVQNDAPTLVRCLFLN